MLAAFLSPPGPAAQAAGTLPCDIHGGAGTGCVAAHSTTRALFSGCNRPLYQVTRASNGATADVGLLSQGGHADAAELSVTAGGHKVYGRRGRFRHRGTGPVRSAAQLAVLSSYSRHSRTTSGCAR